MNTREQAWIYAQEQPTDILIVGRMEREPKVISNRDTVIEKVGKECHEENEAFLNMTDAEKDKRNEDFLKKHNL